MLARRTRRLCVRTKHARVAAPAAAAMHATGARCVMTADVMMSAPPRVDVDDVLGPPPEPRAAAGGALAGAAISPTPVLKGGRVAGAANAGDAAGDTRSVRPPATATECNLSEVQPVVETLEHYFGVERTWRFRAFLERNIDPKWVGATDADLEGLHSLEASAVTRLLELRAAKAEGVPHNKVLSGGDTADKGYFFPVGFGVSGRFTRCCQSCEFPTSSIHVHGRNARPLVTRLQVRRLVLGAAVPRQPAPAACAPHPRRRLQLGAARQRARAAPLRDVARASAARCGNCWTHDMLRPLARPFAPRPLGKRRVKALARCAEDGVLVRVRARGEAASHCFGHALCGPQHAGGRGNGVRKNRLRVETRRVEPLKRDSFCAVRKRTRLDRCTMPSAPSARATCAASCMTMFLGSGATATVCVHIRSAAAPASSPAAATNSRMRRPCRDCRRTSPVPGWT